MAPSTDRRRLTRPAILLGGTLGALLAVGVGLVLFVAVIVLPASPGSTCSDPTGAAGAAGASITLGRPGTGQIVGASEYGGSGDPHSGTVGASGQSLLAHPDSYAELGGMTFETARAMGGLEYMTPLRITWGARSAIAYKRDFGLGGPPVAGRPRVIDLWWQLAGALGIPYENGRWSGAVRVQRPPATGAGSVLVQSVALRAAAAVAAPVILPTGCGSSAGAVPVTTGPRARLLAGGTAAAPADAPPAVKGVIAAGNQIVGKPYTYGGGHGTPLNEVAVTYDCSSSVEHLLYGGRLLPVTYDAASGTLEAFGRPGPGRWVTIYASADHVFMYVAGLRWDTHNAAGADDGSAGIGWHPLVRDAAGFVVRHPVGL
jgi:cell wall-associated NlpC family hydrolase